MKKISTILLAIFLLLIIYSCSTTDSSNSDNNAANDNTNIESSLCDHVWIDASCTEPQKCSLCNKTSGTALGHTTSTGICSRCNKNLSVWKVGEYTDEFGLPTGNKYIASYGYGTFSSMYVTNEDLKACIQIDKENIGITLWEYYQYPVNGLLDYDYYDITILDENGTKHYFKKATLYEGGTLIYFKKSDRDQILDILKTNDTIDIYLQSTRYSGTTYLFTVDTKGFTSIYDTIDE